MRGIPETVRAVDSNIDKMILVSIVHLIQLGTKHRIFSLISSRNPTREELLSRREPVNRRLLSEFLRTVEAMGIVKVDRDGRLGLNGFRYVFEVSDDVYRDLLPSWVAVLEEMYRMADYAFLTPIHPQILMDFDKDADFWDMRMGTEFFSLYREAIIEIAGIKAGKSVLDLGCGSVSPYEFGMAVGYTGFYTGVDYSPSLLEIARGRVERENLPVELKELDINLIRPVNEYDVVVISLVMEYLKPRNYRRVLIRALEALKPGGSLVIFEPFRDRFRGIEAIEFFEKLNGDFVRFPHSSEIKNILSSSGFDIKLNEIGRSFIKVTLLP